MSQNTQLAHQTIDYVYGRDITTLSKADLIASIKQANADIKDLQATGVESTFIDGQVTGLKNAVAQMVTRLDAA
jgi:hypothetical protein